MNVKLCRDAGALWGRGFTGPGRPALLMLPAEHYEPEGWREGLTNINFMGIFIP